MRLEALHGRKLKGVCMSHPHVVLNNLAPLLQATGGTPITTWLPNLLGSTLESMQLCCDTIDHLQSKGDKLSDTDNKLFEEIKTNTSKKIESLRREVRLIRAPRSHRSSVLAKHI